MRNFSESTKAFNSENIVQVCTVSFKTQGQCNTVKDALSEFRVIAFWCRATTRNFSPKYDFSRISTLMSSLSQSDVKWFLEVNHLGI